MVRASTFGQYDAVGNRTIATQTITSTLVTSYTYDAANRLTSVNGVPYTWDANGNLLNDGSKTYLYNQANQLITVTAPGLTWSAAYNGDGASLSSGANRFGAKRAACALAFTPRQDAGLRTLPTRGAGCGRPHTRQSWGARLERTRRPALGCRGGGEDGLMSGAPEPTHDQKADPQHREPREILVKHPAPWKRSVEGEARIPVSFWNVEGRGNRRVGTGEEGYSCT